MTLYRIEMAVAATAYVKAKNKQEAIEKALALSNTFLTVAETPHDDTAEGEIAISGASFDWPGLPEISLSPAMTILGVSGTPSAERV
jgi:hypothetical protein